MREIQSESLYDSLFEKSNSVMLVIEAASGTILDVNASALSFYMYEKQNIVGRCIDLISPFFEPSAHYIARMRALENKQTLFVARHKKSNGDFRDVEIYTTPLIRDDIQAIVSHIYDITERREAERQRDKALKVAQAALKTESNFLASMSHELRTPLNGIMVSAEMVQTEIFGAVGHERYKQCGEDILKSAEKMRTLVDNMFLLFDLDRGTQDLYVSDIWVPDEIKYCLTRFRDTAHLKDVSLSVSCGNANSGGLVVGDADLFRTALLNLVSNALKFTRPGGTVHLYCRRSRDASVVVGVSDTGVGMSEEQVRFLLNSFRQGVNNQERTLAGSGIGLSIVNAIMEIHGGRLDVRSRPNEGSTFEMVFPPARGADHI
ncbi:sensor histidine kinase [Rhodospira trueperi]|uniref:histidine kinase n=1 Tax=Rhodospira trueperi TaxID=69960 RepID=A0A1G7CTP2_9PROT|nr:PAS domain-containing sensor histidine kinase [Rhodospira trueperi]SDE42784.1 PAS domain S-box-containing protein [Rhodospira trueperi]